MPRYHELRILLPLSLFEYSIGHIYTRYRLRHRDNQRSQTELAQCIPYSHPQSQTPSPALSAALSTLPPPSSPSPPAQPSKQQTNPAIPALYTHHVHLFNGLLPQWALTMLNGSPLKIHGKSWDEFPYIVSRYELPAIARATITVDFAHFDQDQGNQHNVFNLSPSQLATRSVEYCDICYDTGIESRELDPKYYQYHGNSHLPPRGPLLPPHQHPSPPQQQQQQQQQQQNRSNKHQIGQPPIWYTTCKQYMCVYVLLGAEFNLPLAMIRNHAIDLAISHFTSIVVELHRLAYVWMHEWDKFVPVQKDHAIISSTTENTPQREHVSKVFALFMADATRNPTTLTMQESPSPDKDTLNNDTNQVIPTGQQPPRPERVIDRHASTIGAHMNPDISSPLNNDRKGKWSLRGIVSSKL